MIKKLSIKVLSDNYVSAPGLIAEHGLSLLIEADGGYVLLDTGQGRALSVNSEVLGCDLAEVQALALSHGHFDHTGALDQFLERNSRATIYLHPVAVRPKFMKRDAGPARPVGTPQSCRDALATVGDRVVWSRTAVEMLPDIWCTGEIPRHAPGPSDNSNFFHDEDCREPDPLVDDQALFLHTAQGVVVLCGCAHAGVVNTLDHVARLTGDERIFAVAGGFHLSHASRDEWEPAGNAFGRRDVRLIAPCHCTGLGARAYFRDRFPSRVIETGVGSRLRLDAS